MTSGGRRVVVTGRAGFIGGTLVDRTLSDGWEVTAVDSSSPSTLAISFPEFVTPVNTHQAVRFQ
jgi:nucleoside-diphosphate-sugar epimerase